MNQAYRIKEFQYQPNKVNQASFFKTLPQYEDNGNQQWREREADSPSSPFQT